MTESVQSASPAESVAPPTTAFSCVSSLGHLSSAVLCLLSALIATCCHASLCSASESRSLGHGGVTCHGIIIPDPSNKSNTLTPGAESHANVKAVTGWIQSAGKRKPQRRRRRRHCN